MLGALAATLGLLAAGQTAPPAPAPDPECLAHAGYAAVLRAVVEGGAVDYARLRDEQLPALAAYLARAGRCDAAALPPPARLALYLNVYNATVLHAVARRLRPGYRVSEGEFGLFHEPLAIVSGQALSLDELEHRRIRRDFAEPRVHAALVCAARSCPALAPRPYRAEDLETTLDRRMRDFVGDPTRNRIDAEGKRLKLSRIFEWYAEDFGGRGGLARFVDRYTDAEVDGFEVEFLEYSWELNAASPAPDPPGV